VNQERDTIANCVGCLASFNVHLELINGTQMKLKSDADYISEARKMCEPKPKKERPEHFSFD
jgi:hypothetical protein